MPLPIIHRNLAVLRATDARILDEIARIVPLQQYVLGRLSETELVIDPMRIGELASRLAERGLPPLVRKAQVEGPMDQDVTTPAR